MAALFADPHRLDGLDRLGRQARRRSVCIAAVGAGAVLAATVVSPREAVSGPVVCPFRLLTGLPCPGCGLTRSWVFWLHGDWQAGFAANPFGIVLLTAAVVFGATVAAALVLGRPLPDVERLARRRVVLLVVALWLGFAVVRMALVAAGLAVG